ncbi:MAG TPA: hypothetical protein VGO97_05475, partial [Solirubrobacterales bacterium]|nr:hypothetical protein [Solirubrobacterales bacterium]
MLRVRTTLGAARDAMTRFADRPLIRPVVRIVEPHAGPVALAVALSAIYFILDLRGGDLAAHLFRAELFKNDGFFVWNYNWYGGHYLVSYGVMFPTLAATIGVRLAGAFAYIVGALLFSMLAREVWSRPGGTAAGYVFSAGFSATLVIGQLPFALAVGFGLAAILAAKTNRSWLAIFLAVNCALTSPLAALFISFVAFVIWFSNRSHVFLGVAVATMLPAMALSILFPEGGSQPFHVASYLTAVAFIAFFWLMVRDDLTPDVRRMVGFGVALYFLFLTANELVASPVGGNAIRLGMMLCAPLAAAALWPRARSFALVAIFPLFAWQVAPAMWAVVTHDKTADPAYFAPVNAFLDKQDPSKQQKVEIVFTRNHFEAAYVANRRPIARGWERQLDT